MKAPLKSMFVTSKFGTYGSQWQFGRHMGVDLRAPVGTPVYAPEAGTINERYVGSKGIKVLGLAGTKWHRFLHLNDFSVANGQKVKAGQLLGHSGNTGKVAAHLHWDARKPGTAWSAAFSNYTDPIKLITKEEEMLTLNGLNVLFRFYRGDSPSAAQIKTYVGKKTFDEMRKQIIEGTAYHAEITAAKAGKLDEKSHLPSGIRKVYHQ